jgi:hypothetical protein
MAKPLTREQAARKKSQAAAFMERIGQPDRAEEFSDMSVDEYAEHKGLRLSNPQRRFKQMPRAKQTGPTKTDLQDLIDSAIEILDDAYEPESTREDLAVAIGSALETLRGEAEDEEEDEEDESEDLDDEDDDPNGN